MHRVSGENLDWALAHVRAFGDTDLLPSPFEYEAIAHDWERVREFLSTRDAQQWSVRPQRTFLTPKARVGFRVVTQLDPLDFLVFSAIVKGLGEDLESFRVPASDGRVFSFRYKHDPNGRLFDAGIGYSGFLRASADRATSHDFVCVTDIADFYPRIYHHRLENALHAASEQRASVKVVHRMLSGWNGTETFGIPVGTAASRLLAEVAISDVDNFLVASGVEFVRYNDDYRLFASSYADAYRAVALLAETLFRSHGLSLQQQKTKILSTDQFAEEYLETPASREMAALHGRFDDLLEGLGISDPYEPIDYDSLDTEQKAQIDSLNLGQLLRDEIAHGDDLDVPLLRFILRRLGQLGDRSVVESVLDSMDELHPVFPDVVRYLQLLQGLSRDERVAIGGRVLRLLDGSVVSELDYHRLWALELFASGTAWGNQDRFLSMLADARGEATRRKLILAMGRAGQRAWFQSRWRSLFDEPPWTRRAQLAGASCMPADARNHWYRSVSTRLDPLESAVSKWARAEPFWDR